MSELTIRPATADDLEQIKEIAVANEMFSADEAEFFNEMIAGALDGSLEDHHWLVVEDTGGVVVGAAQYDEEARIREFYGPGDDKVVFWKKLG